MTDQSNDVLRSIQELRQRIQETRKALSVHPEVFDARDIPELLKQSRRQCDLLATMCEMFEQQERRRQNLQQQLEERIQQILEEQTQQLLEERTQQISAERTQQLLEERTQQLMAERTQQILAPVLPAFYSLLLTIIVLLLLIIFE